MATATRQQAIDVRHRTSQVQLLRTLVERQIRIQIKRSRFGLLWPAVAPLILLAMYVFVFRTVFRAPIPHYTEYLFAGLLPWAFLAQGLGQAITSLSSEPDLIRRARFPYAVLPFATVGMYTVYLLVDLAGFIAYLAIVGRLSWPLLLALPLCVIPLLLLVGSLALVTSIIDVYNRDLRKVLSNLLTLWFFLVPIVYKQNMVPHAMLVLRSVDPLNMIVGAFRQVLYFHHLSRPLHLSLMFGVCGLVFILCFLGFSRFTSDLAKDI